jgi:hypothetical protein
MIERGQRPVTKRSTLEALANALKVSPAELMDKPWQLPTPAAPSGYEGLAAVAAALDSFELGDDPGEPTRDWPEVAVDVERVVDLLLLQADYAASGELIPNLLSELHTLYVRQPELRRDVLLGLIRCYASAVWVTKRLGGGSSGYTVMAAKAAQHCAAELDSPQWRGYTTWLRGDAAGSMNRSLQYQRSVRMAEELTPSLDHPEVIQVYGMLHLSAALAAATQADRDTATTHLAEATEVAGQLDTEVGTFARAWFGPANVGIWRVTIGLELGDGPKVAEQARGVHVEAIPSRSRRSEFYADLGRSMLPDSRLRDNGLALLLRAEELAPQRIRNDVFVREVVADQLRSARRAAAGRELRGLAWRLGIAPTGEP